MTQFIARDGVLAELAEQTGEKRQLERIAAAAATDAADANAQTSDVRTSHPVGEGAKSKKRNSKKRRPRGREDMIREDRKNGGEAERNNSPGRRPIGVSDP